MTQEVNYEQLEKEIEGKRVIVFGGFSGLGYENNDKLKGTINNRIKQDIEKYGKDNVVVVAGATSDGIGACYEVAKELGVSTYGIVSEAGKEYGSDKHCDKTFYVPDPKGTWQVLNDQGSSYMVDVAKNNGALVYYGGGDVAVTEIKEAQERGISVEVDTSFEPNPAQVTKRKAKNPNLDPTPLKTYMEANALQADDSIITLANKEQIKKNMHQINTTDDLQSTTALKLK